MPDITAVSTNHPPQLAAPTDARLRETAEALEASFLAEMLKSAGFGTPRESFGGGVGEEQFGSFLRQAQVEEMVKRGGIGLAESIFESLKERTHDR
ncbi:rod-binding protein [Aliiroseovarius sp. YM-037]|uniref:rod-binding protein n=1 Tax=Aliiroseovarius sp. YM-037 TaxID=3341728 RepID=UPI003A80212F